LVVGVVSGFACVMLNLAGIVLGSMLIEIGQESRAGVMVHFALLLLAAGALALLIQ